MDKEKPPTLGIIQRSGEVVIQMLSNVKQATVAPGTLIYTDEYRIYARLVEWGYKHKQVNHGQGEYVRSGGWRWLL